MAHTRNRLEFETLLSDLSSRFINLPPAAVDREIEDAQRRVREFLNIDLSALWQWSAPAPDVIKLTHLYCAQADSQHLHEMNQDHFPWVRREMLAGRTLILSSLDELPVAAARDRENARRFGIQSNLTLPLSVGGEHPVGALSFNTMRTKHDWPDTW